jgi:hypothetical protein
MKSPFVAMPIDVAYPIFCGAVVSAWLCFFSIFPQFENRTGISFYRLAASSPAQAAYFEDPPKMTQAAIPLSQLPASTFNHHAGEPEDDIMAAYRDETLQPWVTAFFSGVVKPAENFPGTASMEMAAAILSNASAFNVSPSLAFALCWAESRFNPLAVNRANDDGSMDRGLFQLNNRSFPELEEADFFNPSINAYYGMAHLRWCLDAGSSVVAGLAMYNAGTGRVKAEGAPKRTLDYVSYILDFQRKIEDAFTNYPFPVPVPIVEELAAESADFDLPEPAAKTEPYFGKLRLSLLTPIAGKL